MTNTSELDLDHALDVALQAVQAAENIIKRYFRSDLDVIAKEDASPVTQADIESEGVIRQILQQAFPQHGFYGEETGTTSMQSDSIWLVDPIDGTKSFVRQSGFFSTQIALMHKGKLVLGVSNAPCIFDSGQTGGGPTGETAFATRSGKAMINHEAVAVSRVENLQQCFMSAGNLSSLAADVGAWRRYGDLVTSVARTRGYGDFYHYHQLSRGQADLVVESDVNILDIAALSVIVEQAGGVFTDLDGGPIGLQTRSVLAASNPQLHRQALAILHG